MKVPTFAVVGGVNKGKTSVVSTLIEDDSLRISRTPGETTKCQRFSVTIDGSEVLCFIDTPGFQNERNMLAWLKARPDTAPMERLREFRRAHETDPAFDAECELLAPVLDGAGIIYVADASFPLRANHKAEMEILRMTAQPRMAVINCTEDNAPHVEQWRVEMQQHFNLVREFNAHRASFASRIRLLEDLCRIEESWRRDLEKSVLAFQNDWQSRMSRCAEIITELLFDCMTHFETENLADESQLEAAKERLQRKYHRRISALETEAHNQLRKVFKHHRFKIGGSLDEQLFVAGLFSDRTWQAFGLTQPQLIAAGALAGAAGGALIDVATGGHTLGLAAAIGGAVGAGSAWLGGERLAAVEVRLPGKLGRLIGRQSLGGVQLKVGPHRNLNFPWIVVDRALTTCYQLANWTHARREDFTLDPATLEHEAKERGILSASWPGNRRTECEKAFGAIRKNKATAEDRTKLRRALEQALHTLAEN